MVFRYRKATRTTEGNWFLFDLFHRVAMLLNGGGNYGSVYGVEGDWESAV